MSEISVTHLREEHRDEVVALLLAQQARQHSLDPRLAAVRTPEQLTAALAGSGEQALVALDTRGRVRGSAMPGVWEVGETSILRAFLPARSGVARLLALPDPTEADAVAVTTTLLTALSESWRSLGTTGDLVRWPGADSWLSPLLAAHGLRLDSVCATRSLQAFEEAGRISSSPFTTRAARLEDEEALVELLEEELRYHERFTPFVRSSPAVLQAFRRKLARLWHGMSLQEGAPLVLVAERAGKIVAMAENTVLIVRPEDEPGFTPAGRYGCIDNVSVREELRGQGIGRLLVQALFDAFAATGLPLDGSILWYNPDNPQAGRFWPRMGFQPLWTTYQRLHRASGSTEEGA